MWDYIGPFPSIAAVYTFFDPFNQRFPRISLQKFVKNCYKRIKSLGFIRNQQTVQSKVRERRPVFYSVLRENQAHDAGKGGIIR